MPSRKARFTIEKAPTMNIGGCGDHKHLRLRNHYYAELFTKLVLQKFPDWVAHKEWRENS